ncbi:MAG: hypothetical protein Crog4KO_12950 [Crocinitomicaceae bacterium]
MKKIILLQIFVWVALWCSIYAQTPCQVDSTAVSAPSAFNNSVVIAIPDSSTDWCSLGHGTPVKVTFYVIDNNTGASTTIVDSLGGLKDIYKKYKAKMHVRGQATASQPKKQYAVELKQDSVGHFLGMPNTGKHWVFNDCGTFDPTLMRNTLTFNMQTGMGQYAPHYAWFELFLCQPGDDISDMANILQNRYFGVYLNFDKIRFEKHRVTKKNSDKAPKTKDLKNGKYAIIQMNELNSNYEVLSWKSGPAANSEVYEPKKKDYAKTSYAGAFDTVNNWYTNWATPSADLYQTYFVNKSTDTTGKQAKIEAIRNSTDYASFATYFLINEITKDQDGYHKSTFMVKRKDICYAGPLWDKNKSYGNTALTNGAVTYNTVPEGWLFLNGDTAFVHNDTIPNEDANQAPQWWTAMLMDSVYCDTVWQQWTRFKTSYLSAANVKSFVQSEIDFINNSDGTGDTNNTALMRNNKRWPSAHNSSFKKYMGQVEIMNTYIKNRLAWMDENLPALLEPSGFKVPKE